MSNILAELATQIASGGIRVIDLTRTLSADTPILVLPPEWNFSKPFRSELISRYDERGPAWYWNNISCGEHTGTHFDAPVHWVSGKDLPGNATDTIPVEKFIAPACVIDVSSEASANPDFLIGIDDVKAWEAEHGQIPAGAWVFMRTDWSKRSDPEQYLNLAEDGAHTPGPDPALVPFLVKQRDVLGFGNEAVGTDAGQAFAFEPQFPCHSGMHGENRFGLASLCNLDQLPPVGAIIIAAPLKFQNGSGSPCRVLALVSG